jgi:hypothetical protein
MGARAIDDRYSGKFTAPNGRAARIAMSSTAHRRLDEVGRRCL